MNDKRIDRSKTIQKIKTRGGTTVVAGRDQGDVTVGASQPQASTPLARYWLLALISVLLLIVVAGLILGLVHVLDWKYAAIPVIVGALAAVAAVAKIARD